MIPIKTDQTGLIQYQAAAGDGSTTANAFGVPFYIYDVAGLNVYLTPAGTLANDAANLLVYGTDCFGGSYATPISGNYGFIQLTAASFPTGANAGDIITIFYDFGSATIVPQYPLCSTADIVIDGILPALPPGCTWVKNSTGTQILAAPLSSTSAVTLPTVSGSVSIFTNTTGSTQSSNVVLAPATVDAVSYDDVSGIRNLIAEGMITADDLNVLSVATVPALVVRSSLSIYDQNNDNQTIIFGPGTFEANIGYYLPTHQASVLGSLLSNDSTGKLSWMPQTSITSVGAITSGTWNAGAINSSGNISALGAVDGNTGFFPASVESHSFVVTDLTTPTNLSTTIQGPANYGGNYTYTLPTTMGSAKSVLAISTVTSNVAQLAWNPLPQAVRAWVRFSTSPIPGGYMVNIASDSSYNVAAVSRISAGIYDVNFSTPFSSGTSYCWNATGYSASNSGVNVGIFNILQLDSSWSLGVNPQAGSCVFGLYNDSGQLSDPLLPNTPPAVAPTVCISFFGT